MNLFRRLCALALLAIAAATTSTASADTFYLYGSHLANTSVNGWNRETNLVGQPCSASCTNCCYRDAPAPGYIQCSSYVAAGNSAYVDVYLTLDQFSSWTLPAGHAIVSVKIDAFGSYTGGAAGNVRFQVAGHTYTTALSGGCGWLPNPVDVTSLHSSGWTQAQVDALTVGVARPSTAPAQVMYVDSVRIIVTTGLVGACCSSSGVCTVVPNVSCSGSFFAVGPTCSPLPCMGACCDAASVCTTTTSTGCAGTFYLMNSCSASPCPGACCTSGSCNVVPRATCLITSNDWRGGQSCSPNNCPATASFTLHAATTSNDPADPTDGWNYVQNYLGSALCGSGSGDCYGANQSNCASNSPSGYTGYLTTTAWSSWSLPSGYAITRVRIDVHGAFESAASGQYRLRVNGGSPSTFTHSGGCSWMPTRWDITSLNPGWTKAAIDSLRVGIARASASSPAVPLYIDNMELLIDATNVGACCNLTSGACSTTLPTACSTGLWIPTSCTPNPCPQVGACCAAGAACAITPPASCAGTWTPATACSAALCDTKACCSAGGVCAITVSAACTGNARWGPALTCSPNQCPGALGVCCRADGSCALIDLPSCGTETWLTSGTCDDCAPSVSGAGISAALTSSCCSLSGVCQVLPPPLCTGTNTPGSCPPTFCTVAPQGACCSGGPCTTNTASGCSGVFAGAGTSCQNCPATFDGACCTGAGACTVVLQAACAAASSQFFSVGSVCGPTPCSSVAVSITPAGSGRGRVTSFPPGLDCTGPCSAPFPPYTTILLTATPAPNSVFVGWDGACAGSAPCTITPDRPAPISARFRCRGDFDDDGVVAVSDIFSFLNAWFGVSPEADFNGSGSLDVNDVFAFLASWFQAC